MQQIQIAHVSATGVISGGYHLPFTAVAMAPGQGGPRPAILTCLAAIVAARFADRPVASSLGDAV